MKNIRREYEGVEFNVYLIALYLYVIINGNLPNLSFPYFCESTSIKRNLLLTIQMSFLLSIFDLLLSKIVRTNSRVFIIRYTSIVHIECTYVIENCSNIEKLKMSNDIANNSAKRLTKRKILQLPIIWKFSTVWQNSTFVNFWRWYNQSNTENYIVIQYSTFFLLLFLRP